MQIGEEATEGDTQPDAMCPVSSHPTYPSYVYALIDVRLVCHSGYRCMCSVIFISILLSALSYVRVRGCVVLWLCVCACVYECMIVFFCQTLVVRSTIPCSHNLCVCTQAVARFPCHCARMHSSNLPLICTALYIDAPFAHMLYMVYTGTQVGQKNTLLTSCIPVEPVPPLITPVSLISI